MESGVQMTLEQWAPEIFQRPTVGVLEHHARTSRLQEKELASKETDPHSLGKYLESLTRSGKKINPNGLSMRTLGECLAVTEDLTSLQYSLNWIGGGTTSNGNYSTLNCTEYLKTESEFTLSDILEDAVSEKYFLSRQQVEKVVFTP